MLDAYREETGDLFHVPGTIVLIKLRSPVSLVLLFSVGFLSGGNRGCVLCSGDDRFNQSFYEIMSLKKRPIMSLTRLR